MEGNVYKCEVAPCAGGVSISVSGNPELRVKRKSTADAIDALRQLILRKTGDGEAFIEIINSADDSTVESSRAESFALEYNTLVAWDTGNRSALWSGGYCKKCLHGKLDRTNVQRIISEVPKCDLCGLIDDRNGCLICSERFAGFVRECAPRIRLMEVGFSCSVRGKKFFEMVPELPLPFVLTKRAKLGRGWQCGACKLFYAPQISEGIPTGNSFYMQSCDHEQVQHHGFDWAGLGITVRLVASRGIVEQTNHFGSFKGIICERVAAVRCSEICANDSLKLPKFTS